MITGREIVILSSVDWDFLWQGQHEIASRLARGGNRVLYVENTGVRSPRLGDAGRVATRVRGRLRSLGSRRAREVARGLFVCSPVLLPPFGPRWRREANRMLFLPAVRRAAQELGMRDPVLLTFLPTDTVLDLIRLVGTRESTVVYVCLADFAKLTPHQVRLRLAEAELLRSSDLVLAQGSRLLAHCSRWSERVHAIECAVSLEAFSALNGCDDEAPVAGPHEGDGESPLAGLPRPIIGYVGGLHKHLDVGLAAEIARARPDWSWVYVGPSQAPVDELAATPNVRLVGRVPHRALAGYIRCFDAGIVPYRVGPRTDTVFPTKLIEYLAMGRPVVSTALPEVREFNAEWPVLRIAEGRPDAFVEAIEAELASTGKKPSRMRRRAAASRDWAAQLERISDLIEAAGGEVSARGDACLDQDVPPPARL